MTYTEEKRQELKAAMQKLIDERDAAQEAAHEAWVHKLQCGYAYFDNPNTETRSARTDANNRSQQASKRYADAMQAIRKFNNHMLMEMAFFGSEQVGETETNIYVFDKDGTPEDLEDIVTKMLDGGIYEIKRKNGEETPNCVSLNLHNKIDMYDPDYLEKLTTYEVIFSDCNHDDTFFQTVRHAQHCVDIVHALGMESITVDKTGSDEGIEDYVVDIKVPVRWEM